MKKTVFVCVLFLVCFVVAGGASFGSIINGGFESGMTGWSASYSNDTTNWGYEHQLYATSAYHHSGGNALWGSSLIVGDQSPWWQDDFSRTYAWSAYTDLTKTDSISLYLTNFQTNPNHFGWGYGQEVYLAISDGTDLVQALLIDHHEPAYTSIFDLGKYTTSLGNDGRTWYKFDVPLTAEYFGAGISAIDMTSAKFGPCWEALNWYDWSSQTLWAGAAVDDVCQNVPEPATWLLFSGGGVALLFWRRKKK